MKNVLSMTRIVTPIILRAVMLPALMLPAMTLPSLILPSSASAATYRIEPDGTGDFPTIQEALDAAVDGDIIELADGTFIGDGNRDLDFLGLAVVLRSENDDPSVCIIDCEGSPGDPHRALVFSNGEGPATQVIGISFTNGWSPEGEHGGVVFCTNLSSPGFENCLFDGNSAGDQGNGGAVAVLEGAAPTFAGCDFTQNVARNGGGIAVQNASALFTGCEWVGNRAEFFDGGAVYCIESSPEFTECRFADNIASFGGGIFLISDSDATLVDCVLLGNQALSVGGGMVLSNSSPSLQGCTLVGNSAQAYFGDGGGGFWCSFGSSPVIENTLIAFNEGGGGVVCEEGSHPGFSCSDIFGNVGGDWTGELEDQQDLNGNFSIDPYLCDLDRRDLRLAANSPCMPGFNSCGVLIGALGEGCGAVPTLHRTWGRIKADFR